MKPTVVIAIVICAIAVSGVLIGLQQFVTNQAQIALEEYEIKQKTKMDSSITQLSSKLLLQDCSINDDCITEKITKIIDGDTIHTVNYKIRLSLTNTPEKNQTGFDEAAAFTASLCPVGSTIVVNQDDLQQYDSYGRLLGKVYCGDKVLNSELLYNEHANILKKYCDTSEFSKEDWAKEFGC